MTTDTDEIPPVGLTLVAPQISEGTDSGASAHTTPPSESVLAIRTETKTGAPIPQMSSRVKEARLLEALALTRGAKRIPDVGTFTGATMLSLAAVLAPDARIVTLERDEAMAAIASVGDPRDVGAELDDVGDR